jgi:hypothetical protein
MIRLILGIPSIEPQLLCSCSVFPFKLLFKVNFNRFKRKNPALSCWVLFVTPRIEKSNFYKDIEKVIEWEFKKLKKE